MTDIQKRLQAISALQPQGVRLIERDLAYTGMVSQKDAYGELTEEEKRQRHVLAQQEYRRRNK